MKIVTGNDLKTGEVVEFVNEEIEALQKKSLDFKSKPKPKPTST